MNRSNWRGPARVVLASIFVLSLAAPAAADGVGRELGRGLALVGTNIFYMPGKILYAAGGGLSAGVAWIFSGGDGEVAGNIVDASVRGDYVVTADHLDGRERLEFIGRSPEQRVAERQASWDDPASVNEGF